ncbi:hypothetical protein [Prosthecobacter sp. SYSU 5D2]|uniref:hypothetical protein n=1 Tax=Prosthecobacter sp. SYSU 5D2 TaxID=3134134 RepID=UPI0031FF22B3
MDRGYSIDFRAFSSLWNNRKSYDPADTSALELLVEAFGHRLGITELDQASLSKIHDAIQASTSQYSLYHIAMNVWR